MEICAGFISMFQKSLEQFLIRAVSRKYSKIWLRFTSEIKVEKENYRNEILICCLVTV